MPSWTTPPTWTSGQVLTTSQLTTLSNDLTFLSQPPSARIYASTGQSIPNLTATQITPTTTEFASGITAASGSLTIVTAGTYLVTGIVTYGGAASSDSQFTAFIHLNGSAVRVGTMTGGGALASGAANVTDLIKCGVGDVLQLWAGQGTGGAYALDTTGTPHDTSLSALWVSF